MATPPELARIAATIATYRPDWPEASLRTLLTSRPELARRPAADLFVALAVIAADVTTRSPARLIEAGPWWLAAAAGNGDRGATPTPTAPECPEHPGVRLHGVCPDCAAEADRVDHAARAAEVRASMRAEAGRGQARRLAIAEIRDRTRVEVERGRARRAAVAEARAVAAVDIPTIDTAADR
jgi:hypothetical protein